MTCYENFDWLHPALQSRPFKALYTIAWRANQILRKRDPGQWSDAAEALADWIEEFKESRLKEETCKYIKDRSEELAAEGGWELAYLPRDPWDPHQYSGPAGTDEIRHLLENWPSDADDRPDFPRADDVDDLDTLSDILCSGYPCDDIEGFPGAQEFELYAVLALMKINQSVWCLRIDDNIAKSKLPESLGANPWEPTALIEAGELTIEAMEIICFAEKELRDFQFAQMRTERESNLETKLKAEIRKIDEDQRREMLSAAGRLGAQKKNLDSTRLKEWALEQADSLRGSDIEIARRLASQLPPHLTKVSKDPERLIYDALRTRKRR